MLRSSETEKLRLPCQIFPAFKRYKSSVKPPLLLSQRLKVLPPSRRTKMPNKFKWRLQRQQHQDLHEGLWLSDPSQINKKDLTCLWQPWYITHTLTHMREHLELLPQMGWNYSQKIKANKTPYFPSTVGLNNGLPCTLAAVWGGEGGHGAPQCDGSALICPVWPIHMCSHHCFHILNKNCNVPPGNLKCSMLKSINFSVSLKITPSH